MLKVAVIGAGTMGSTHAHSYVKMTNAKLVGIVDIRGEKAEALAQKCSTSAFSTFDELLTTEDPDIIDICVPTYLHKSFVYQASAAKKHVICEKPITRTLQEAAEMIQICKEAGVRLFIGQVVRFFPEYKQIYDTLKAGEIGEIGTVHAFRGGGFPGGSWGDWYANVAKSGSLIVDLMIHDIDYLRWCFGEVERVYAKSLLGRELNRFDHAFVSLRFKNGVIAHVEGSWAYPGGFRTELEVCGREGIVHYDSAQAAPIHTSLRTTAAGGSGVAVPESPLQKSPYQLELEHFVDCIAQNKEPIVRAEDAYKALEISLAALESAQTGSVVKLM
ncbi:Gfo/Idh/MocA family protein [Alicyclobacillus fodiniaquatilis]|uniref:Gfo/Idh/MocA family protein n=1 Tax=Alicyclobacillus fodiniaquatilis TaxID=1661150 RepID=A0ABW4JJ33_9BACL